MPFVVTCEGCRKKMKIPDSLIGKSAKCPRCARRLNTSAPPNPDANPGAKLQPEAKESSETREMPGPPAETCEIPAPSKRPVTKTGLSAPPNAKPKPKTKVAADTCEMPAPPKRPAKKSVSAADESDAPPPTKSVAKRKGEANSSPPLAPPRAGGRRELLFLAGAGGFVVVLLALPIWYLFFSGPSLHDVSGLVALDGEPMEEVKVQFIGIEPAGQDYTTKTDHLGKYRFPVVAGKGLPAGKYKVVISKMVMLNGELIPDGEHEPTLLAAGKIKHRFAEVYSTPQKSILHTVVKAGSNTADFELKAQVQPEEDTPPLPKK